MGFRNYYEKKSSSIAPETEVCIMSGNTKLGKIWNTSFPPVWSCSVNAPCYKECYARKAFRQYPDTREAWIRNYGLYQADPNKYFRQINAFLSDVSPEHFRWLVAGDVVDTRYMTGVLELANRYPETNYCLFSKNYGVLIGLVRGGMYVPENLTILASAWPGHKLPVELQENYRVAWMQDGTETRAPENAIVCEGSCINCLKCYNPKVQRDVILPIH